MVCMMEPSRTLFARTGALAGRVCTKPVKGKCAVRILNASEELITLYKNTTVGVLQLVVEAVNYVEDEEGGPVEGDESDFDDLPVTAPAKDLTRKVEIPAHVLCDKEATKRYLKDLRRKERDRKRLEEAATTTEELPEHVVDLYERAIKQVPKDYHTKTHKIFTLFKCKLYITISF